MIKQPPRINVKQEEADGVYSNLVLIAFSRDEFVLDFARMMPGIKTASVKSRVIMSPHKAKAFVKALQHRIEAYEKKHGGLEASEMQSQMGFQNPQAEREEGD
ncbi:MAG: DUF3467 domain-containing protein [Candidatus Fermentibacteraceae bacterium]